MSTNASGYFKALASYPTLTVNDLAATIRFYEGLGFVVIDRWEDKGTLRGVVFQAGEARVGVSQDDWAKGKDRVKGAGYRFWIETDQDVDDLAKKAKAAGVKLDSEPTDMPWGGRAFATTDPDGFAISICRMTT